MASRSRRGCATAGSPWSTPAAPSTVARLVWIDAHGTLLDAVARGALDVRGTADALDAAADAFATFLHGMVRAPSSARLLADLRREVVSSDPENPHGQ